MLDCLPLHLQIRQRLPPNILRLVRNPLTIPQPLRAPIQSIGPGQQLLSLLQLVVCAGVVGIVVPVRRFSVIRQAFEFPLCAIDVRFVIPESLVYLRAGGGGDVGFFEAHLIELSGVDQCVAVPKIRTLWEGWVPVLELPRALAPIIGWRTFEARRRARILVQASGSGLLGRA